MQLVFGEKFSDLHSNLSSDNQMIFGKKALSWRESYRKDFQRIVSWKCGESA